MRDVKRFRTPTGRLKRIQEIIESVEQRAMAADGPVTNTRHEMSDAEMLSIYELACGYPLVVR